MEKGKHEIMLCACSSDEHQIIFHPFEDIKLDNGKLIKSVYCSILLNNLPFFSRLKNAIKYIFGYKCKFGHFEEFIIDSNNVEKLKKVIDFIEK